MIRGYQVSFSVKVLQKSIFLTAQASALAVFSDISRNLKEKYFSIVWGYSNHGNPHMNPTKINFFQRLKLRPQFFFDISRYVTNKYFEINIFYFDIRYDQRVSGVILCEDNPKINFF